MAKSPKGGWYSETVAATGTVVHGTAALLTRISAMGGMDNVVAAVATETLKQADKAVTERHVKKGKDGIIDFPNKRKKRSA